MEDESDSLFSTLFGKLFKRDDSVLEKFIHSAKRDGDLTGDEVSLLLNVLRLGRKQVREIMIPRTDIACEAVDEPLQAVAEHLMKRGHSRIPIYQDNRDNIVGIVHAKDMLRHCMLGGDPKSTADIMRKPLFIPDTKNVMDMLQVFRTRKIHMAIALDEYGGTSGLVTLEDVLEEIVGDIEDEYDAPRPDDIQVLENGDILVSGRTPLFELDEQFNLQLTSEQVDTVSGFVCELAGRVPYSGETFSTDGHRLIIKEADPKQVHWLIIQAVERPKADD
ncbi:hemolysin family protein [Desulfovibrio ferrophilus]|uniref:CBS domain containing protein n=1 Tax=Desulfovibrio ferrophilus TaxID=241368 RepID=A0A2Z6AWJ0_9BACT|nr:hemolysin family protein [Desulfovibrio ferrophilus]BBD07591.1 CBS domain containing protein [Desulfovibrio ferrophilus]